MRFIKYAYWRLYWVIKLKSFKRPLTVEDIGRRIETDEDWEMVARAIISQWGDQDSLDKFIEECEKPSEG